MGSYNQTCAITHLPIQDGDAVAGFILAKVERGIHESFEGYTSGGGAWQSVTLPFLGAYDDSGEVVLDGSPETRLAATTASLSTGLGLAEILSMAAEGRDPSEAAKGKTLRLMLVHRGAYDRLVESDATTSYGPKAYATEAARVLEYADVIAAASAGDRAGSPGPFATMPEIETWSERTGRHWTETPHVARFFENPNGVSPTLRRSVLRMMNLRAVEGDRAGLEGLLQAALRMRILDANMQALRRTWAPQAGLGSNDEDHGLHRELAEWTLERCASAVADPDDDPDAAPSP